MVANFVDLIKTSEEKVLEAEQQTRLVKEALTDADDARNEAENARREGMLQAVGHLEKIVDQITSASQELSAQIEQSVPVLNCKGRGLQKLLLQWRK